jgi:deoxyribose-phosphate aldolase
MHSGSKKFSGLGPRELAQYIDHTLLRPEATEPEIARLCQEAVEYHFKTVCIESRWLPFAVGLLRSSSVLPITVIGFPGGDAPTERKVAEAHLAVQAGARELDMVLNRGWLAKRDYRAVLHDIESVVQAASGLGVKVILETSELSDEEKTIACALVKSAGAQFVKTSTGFSRGGATVEDVRRMRAVVGPEMGVKASGGIRSYADAILMLEAGATRLGTSASVAIVTQSKADGAKY